MQEPEQIDTTKFDTCKYRSSKQEEIGEYSCCVDNRHFGYVCFRRNIEDLDSSQCIECNFYKKKINVN